MGRHGIDIFVTIFLINFFDIDPGIGQPFRQTSFILNLIQIMRMTTSSSNLQIDLMRFSFDYDIFGYRSRRSWYSGMYGVYYT